MRLLENTKSDCDGGAMRCTSAVDGALAASPLCHMVATWFSDSKSLHSIEYIIHVDVVRVHSLPVSSCTKTEQRLIAGLPQRTTTR